MEGDWNVSNFVNELVTGSLELFYICCQYTALTDCSQVIMQ